MRDRFSACPQALRDMGDITTDPLEAQLERFAADRDYWDPPEGVGEDRDVRTVSYASAKGSGRGSMAPVQFANREDVWGGGLRRMTSGSVGPRREDEHHYATRYVPIGFGRYVPPTINSEDYRFYQLAGWRVAVPRSAAGPVARALLLRMYQYGPEAAGYARMGDTLVPALLGPGDRQTLAETESRLGSARLKYPLQ